MTALWQAGFLLAMALPAACQTVATPAAVPAWLTNPGSEVQQELVQALTAMSGFASVSLSGNELTRSSELVLERRHQRDGRGGLLQGRDLEPPQRFQLLLLQEQCWLLHLPSGRQLRLFKAQCRAQPSAP